MKKHIQRTMYLICALSCAFCVVLSGCGTVSTENNVNTPSKDFGQISDVQKPNTADSNSNLANSETTSAPANTSNIADAAERTVIASNNNNGTIPTAAYLPDFPVLLQGSEMPSGCEITSLTMVLNYWGFDCTKFELADNYLEYGEEGDNMFSLMIGDVYSDYSLGCYADAIVNCARAYAADQGASLTAQNISGSSLEEYCSQVAAGHPMIVWATEGMEETWPEDTWIYDGVETGYMHGEHCLVMIGYDTDTDTVVMADPLRGEVEYSLSEFYELNQEVFAQAVLITVP